MLGINKSMHKITYYENILEFKENNKEDFNLNEINNWKLCRTCLVDTDENDVNMENMSIMDVMHGTLLNLEEMLVDITSIKISKTENLPLQVCNTCFKKITELYYFCIQIRKAEKVISRLANRFKDDSDAIGACEPNNNIEVEDQEYIQDIENISVITNISIDEDNVPKQGSNESSALFKEISDTGAVLLKGEEVSLFDNEVETFFQDEGAQSETHGEQNNCSSDEESNLENNLIEYLDISDADNEGSPTNFTAETNKSIRWKLKETKIRALKKRVTSDKTGYRHKQPRVTSPLLVDFDCAICQISFGRQQDLVQHVRESHPNSKAYKCRVCGNFFSHIQSLSRHMNSHKESVILNECEYCSKSFVRVDDLKRHVRVHTGERPYVCSICEKSFQQLSDLKIHQKKHDYDANNLQPRIYKCNQCQKAYTSRTGLNWHTKKHHILEKVSDLKRHSVRHLTQHTSRSEVEKESEKENEDDFTLVDDDD